MAPAPAIFTPRAYPGFWQSVLLAGELLWLRVLFVLELPSTIGIALVMRSV